MTDLTVAKTIITQMGGQRRLRMMVNARQYIASEKSVKFTFSGSRKVNRCRVELDFASDTYVFQLWQYRPSKGKMVKKYELEGVYHDMLIDLFESETGLRLSLGF